MREKHTHAQCLANPTIDASYLPDGLVFFSWTLVILIMGGCLGLAIWIWTYRMHGIVNASSPIFMVQMSIGCMLQVSSVIPMAMQENYVNSVASLDVACMAVPWLYFSGFTLIYAPLLVKSYRIYRLFSNKLLRKFKITNIDLIRMEIVGSIPVFGLLILWQFYAPMVWSRVVTGTDSATGLVFATAGACSSSNYGATLVRCYVSRIQS